MVGSALLSAYGLFAGVCVRTCVPSTLCDAHERVLSHNFLNEDFVNMSCSLFLVEVLFCLGGCSRADISHLFICFVNGGGLWAAVWAPLTISFWQNTPRVCWYVECNRIYQDRQRLSKWNWNAMGCKALMIENERHFLTVSLENISSSSWGQQDSKKNPSCSLNKAASCYAFWNVLCVCTFGDTVSEMGYLNARGSVKNARASPVRHPHAG